ncbi:hypothetical protein MKEN_00219700 [Mycena kentingensis (nom. inval.)]|nr:hypothetical protein MKEN_00219700 [Mycena kentingensis (nom. inval.)]
MSPPTTPRKQRSPHSASPSPRKRRVAGVPSPYFCPDTPRWPDSRSSRYFTDNPSRPRASSPVEEPAVVYDLPEPFRARLRDLKPNLIQERVASDPWKVLVAVTLLNKTAGKLALPVFWDMMTRWPTPFALSQVAESELVTLLHPLGTQNRRAQRLIALSRAYLLDPPSTHDPRRSRASGPLISPRKRARYPETPISHLPGAGAYALDSYRIFCAGGDEWRAVRPSDKELVRYLRWRWAVEAGMLWDPVLGAVRRLDEQSAESLVEDLAIGSATVLHSNESNISTSIVLREEL